MRVLAPRDDSGAFQRVPAAQHVGEDFGPGFRAPYRPAGNEARASTDPDRGYEGFIDDIIAAAEWLAGPRPAPATRACTAPASNC